MARGHTDWDDELCSLCSGAISAWGNVPQGNQVQGYCSWCYKLADHTLRDSNIILRSGYTCENCGGPTAQCISCSSGFTRCSSFFNELLCAKCEGSIQDWEALDEKQQMNLQSCK